MSLNSSGTNVYMFHTQKKTGDDNRLRVPPLCHFYDQRTRYYIKLTARMLQKHEYTVGYLYCFTVHSEDSLIIKNQQMHYYILCLF
jgi:hypothetical protein